MRIYREKQRLLFVVIAVTAFCIGYAAIAGIPFSRTKAAERSTTLPEEPYIFYLAPKGTQRGALNEQVVIEKGGTVAEEATWEAAKEAAQQTALDALLVDVSLLTQTTAADQAWLREQAQEGVVIVGLGADEQLAEALSVSTFLAPSEAVIPAGETDYRQVSVLLLAHPADMQKLEGIDWLERLAQSGETSPFNDILFEYPLIYSFGTGRKILDTNEAVDDLFRSVQSHIEEQYSRRAEFQEVIIRG